MSDLTIHQAMNLVMKAVRSVGKDSFNDQQRYKFRGIDGVLNAVGPALRDAGVIVVPDVRSYEYGSVEVGAKRTPMGHARVVVAYTFYGPAGDSIVTSAPGEAFDSGDKATPKAMSVAFRTALLQALALPTDDPDPDSQSYERSGPPVKSDADVARDELRAYCADQNLILTDVAEQFSKGHEGLSLKAADAETVRTFLASLSVDPWAVDGVNVPETDAP